MFVPFYHMFVRVVTVVNTFGWPQLVGLGFEPSVLPERTGQESVCQR